MEATSTTATCKMLPGTLTCQEVSGEHAADQLSNSVALCGTMLVKYSARALP